MGVAWGLHGGCMGVAWGSYGGGAYGRYMGVILGHTRSHGITWGTRVGHMGVTRGHVGSRGVTWGRTAAEWRADSACASTLAWGKWRCVGVSVSDGSRLG
eukprot:4393056-Prymnesium_polylepis.1